MHSLNSCIFVYNHSMFPDVPLLVLSYSFLPPSPSTLALFLHSIPPVFPLFCLRSSSSFPSFFLLSSSFLYASSSRPRFLLFSSSSLRSILPDFHLILLDSLGMLPHFSPFPILVFSSVVSFSTLFLLPAPFLDPLSLSLPSSSFLRALFTYFPLFLLSCSFLPPS